MKDLQPQLHVAQEAAKIAGKILIESFETSLEPDIKADKSFVTKVDTDSEKAIIDTITKSFPDHTFLGEESGKSDGTSPWQWVIDPLDGTANFLNGIPIFSVSIALDYEGETVVGVVYNPVTSSMFYATKDGGSFWNDKPIKVSDQTEVNVVTTVGSSPSREDGDKKIALTKAFYEEGMRVRLLGSAALELAYLARGGTEVYINLGTKPWDYNAGLLIAQEAGAMITRFDGSPRKESTYFLATNGAIHPKILEIIKKTL